MARQMLELLSPFVVFGFILSTNIIKVFGQDEHFYVRNCSHLDRYQLPLVVQNMSVSPDPVQLGQSMTVNGLNFTLLKEIGDGNNKVEVDLSIRLRTPYGQPTEICELVGEEFCHFNDICELLKNKFQDHCPLKLMNMNCTCPIIKETYGFPFPFEIFLTPLPFELRGSFDVTVNIKEQGTHIGCFEIHFCIGICKPWEYL